jgi:hypothetical protein
MRGLGDVVAVVADPVKQIIMKHGPGWARKRLANCKCAERRAALNRMFPI